VTSPLGTWLAFHLSGTGMHFALAHPWNSPRPKLSRSLEMKYSGCPQARFPLSLPVFVQLQHVSSLCLGILSLVHPLTGQRPFALRRNLAATVALAAPWTNQVHSTSTLTKRSGSICLKGALKTTLDSSARTRHPCEC
jgi:hypothetical protein